MGLISFMKEAGEKLFGRGEAKAAQETAAAAPTQANVDAANGAAAQAIKAGKGSDFDRSIMGREARLRGMGESVEQLADKVISNSLIFASVGAAVDGIERATMDKISAYNGADPAKFDAILAEAKQLALAEFLDIFTPFVGVDGAKARARAFFG